MECRESWVSPSPGAAGLGECVTERIGCGQTIEGNNTGGSTLFGTESDEQFYYCSGSAEGDDLAGPERVYLVDDLQGVTTVKATLQTCKRSWLFYYRGGSQVCPTGEVTCGYAPYGDFFDMYAEILLGGTDAVWLIVEGDENEGGNFRLTVECF